MPSNPLLQVVYVLRGGVVLIGALLVGAVLLTVALALGLIVGVAAILRAWWLGRGRPRRAPGRPDQGQSTGRAPLEAEYRVVAERDERDRREP